MGSCSTISGQDMVVLAALTGAANAGLPCPSNDDILAMTGAASPSSSAAILKKLEKRGLITVERFTNSRRVTIIETGRRTAAVPGRSRAKEVSAKHRAGMDATLLGRRLSASKPRKRTGWPCSVRPALIVSRASAAASALTSAAATALRHPVSPS
jgi:hypothetical protein